MDYQNNTFSKRRIVVLCTSIMAVVLLLIGFLYVLDHGKITIDQSAKWSGFTVQSPGGSVEQYTPGSLLKHGEYLLTLTNKESSYSQKVVVPRFFKSANVVTKDTNQAHATKLARSTRDLHVFSGLTVYAMDKDSVDGIVVKHEQVPNFPYVTSVTKQISGFFKPLLAVDNSFIGLAVDSSGEDTYSLAKYSPTQDKISLLNGSGAVGSVNGVDSSIKVMKNKTNDSFIVSKEGKLFSFENVDSQAKIIKTSSSQRNNDSPTVACLSGEKVGVYNGDSFDPSDYSGEGRDVEKKTNNATISIYDIKNNKLDKTIKTSLEYPVSEISCSEDMAFFALPTNTEQLNIVDGSGSVKQSVPINAVDGNISWVDNKTVVFIDPLLGLRKLNVAEGYITTLFASTLLAYSSYEIRNNAEVLLTAYLKIPDARIATERMLFSLKLTDSRNNKIVTKTPYSTTEYYLDTYNDKVYFTPLAFGSRDILFDDLTARKKAIDARFAEALSYLKQAGISENSVVKDNNLRTVEEFISF